MAETNLQERVNFLCFLDIEWNYQKKIIIIYTHRYIYMYACIYIIKIVFLLVIPFGVYKFFFTSKDFSL